MSRSFPEPRPFQSKAQIDLRKGFAMGHRCQVLMAPTGAGKCLKIGTPVLMANGIIKPVESIQVGDWLATPTIPKQVLSVASGKSMLWQVSPIKGDPYVCNEGHLLSLKKTPGSDGLNLSNGDRITKSTDIAFVPVEVLAQSNKTAKHCLKGWRSHVSFFLDERTSFPIPPYIMGVWLGDGSIGLPQITKPPGPIVNEWINFGKSLGLGFSIYGTNEKCPTWRITNGYIGGKSNLLTSLLDIEGVLWQKHIPHGYLTASFSNRLELIAGLLDTDGHATHGGYDWISVSELLAHQMAFLCRSVGLACYISPCTKGIKSIGFSGVYYRCSISGNCHIIPCRQKKVVERRQKKSALVTGITVEPIGEGEYFGFELAKNFEGEDGQFLLGDFTVTHNTYLSMLLIKGALDKGKRALFVCDRITLIDQTSSVADSYGLSNHGVIQANHWRKNMEPFQICSVQTLANRGWPDADLIIIDECHALFKTWSEHIPKITSAVIGLSATPFAVGLGDLFSNLINAATMHELVQSGVLVPMKIFSCTPTNMKGAETSGGEWTDRAAGERGMEIVGDVVSEWVKFGDNRKTICFGATIAHCEEIGRQFNQVGIPARVFTCETKAAERNEILEEYRKPDSAIKVLISVEALAKGFDVRDVGTLIDCRPLRKSLSTAIQMWGRGMRCSPETGKTDCILLDHSGNVVRFAEDFEDIYFNGLAELKSGERMDKTIRREDEDKPEGKGCPKCGHKPFFKRCIQCGHERIEQSLIAHEPGVMREITLGSRKLADDHRHLWEQVCTYARKHSKPERQSGRAFHLFQDITKTKPDPSWRFETTPDVPILKATANKIRSMNIAFIKGRFRTPSRSAASGDIK